MIVKANTNRGRFILGVPTAVVESFYDYVSKIAKRDIEKILIEEQQGKAKDESRTTEGT